MTDTKVPLLDLPDSEGDPNQLAELYADRLMDDLFDGVERALTGDAAALDALQTPLAEPASPDLAVNAANTEGTLAATIDVASILASDTASTLSYSLATAAASGQETAAPVKPKRRWLMIPLALGAAGISVATALLLGWLSQRQSVAPASVVPAPSVDAIATSPDIEFLEYLRRSLEVISQQTGTASTTGVPGGIPETSVALNVPGLGLPPINSSTLPSGVAPSPNGLAQINVIERIYVPYQAGQPAVVAGSPTTVVPGVATPTAVPASSQVLVGILELGDRSAALFEIDGVPQRVYIGERIANSGWSLVSVANGEATVRRNGEVRSIFIGQQF